MMKEQDTRMTPVNELRNLVDGLEWTGRLPMIRCTPTMGFKYSNQGRDSTVIVTLLHREGLYEGSLLDLAKDIITGGEYYGFYDLDAVVWEISIANSFHGYDDRVVELFEQMGVDVGDDKHLNQWLVVRCSDWAS